MRTTLLNSLYHKKIDKNLMPTSATQLDLIIVLFFYHYQNFLSQINKIK